MLTKKSGKEQRQRAKLSSALTDSVVIVTRASSGIGVATAREFARHGAQSNPGGIAEIINYQPGRLKQSHL